MKDKKQAIGTRQQEKLQKRIEELTADLKRLQADFINYKRRTADEQQQLMQVAREQVVLQILPLLDNIQRGLTYLPQELADNAWASGVQKVDKQAQANLKGLGVEPIEALGQEFDPNLHQAVGFDDGEGEREVVVEELQTGYRMGERIIRPSMVRVGKLKQKEQ